MLYDVGHSQSLDQEQTGSPSHPAWPNLSHYSQLRPPPQIPEACVTDLTTGSMNLLARKVHLEDVHRAGLGLAHKVPVAANESDIPQRYPFINVAFDSANLSAR